MGAEFRLLSTDGQTLAAQDAQLHAAGAAKVYGEKVSGAKTDRAELAKLLKRLEAGDVLMVTRLDRLARHGERRVERVGVLHRHQRGHAFGSRLDREALHHMQLLAVWRAKIVDVADPGGEPNGYRPPACRHFRNGRSIRRTRIQSTTDECKSQQLQCRAAVNGGDIADWASNTSTTQSNTLGLSKGSQDAYDAFTFPGENGQLSLSDIVEDAALGYKLSPIGNVALLANYVAASFPGAAGLTAVVHDGQAANQQPILSIAHA